MRLLVPGMSIKGAFLAMRGIGGGIAAPSRLMVVYGGQSLADYVFTRGTPRAGIVMGEELRTHFGYTAARDFASYSSGAMIHDGVTSGADDWTVKLVNKASGGSALIGSFTSSGERIAGNYWWNDADYSAETGDELNQADTPGPLWRSLITELEAQASNVNAFVWSQGETDMGQIPWPTDSNGNIALYKDTLKALFAAVRTACGKPSLPIFIQRLGRHQTSSNTGPASLRQLQAEVCDEMSRVFIGAEQYDVRFATTATKASVTANGTTGLTLSNTSGMSNNNGLEGDYVSDGAYIVSFVASTSITMSEAATGSGSFTLRQLDNVHPYPGADGVQPLDTTGATAHNETDGFYAIVKRMSRSIAAYFGVGDIAYWQGPRIASAVQSGANVDLTIEHDGGTDLTVPNVAGMWRVTLASPSSPLTISSVARVNATTIRLTLSGTPGAGELLLWHVFGAQNRRGVDDFVRDNASPLAMPLQPIDRLVITRA